MSKTTAMKAEKEMLRKAWAWDQKKVSPERLRGIMKGIIIDGVITRKEYPYFKGAMNLTDDNEARAHATKRYNARKILNDDDINELKRYTEYLPRIYKRAQTLKGKKRAAAEAEHAERAKQDAIASVTSNLSKIKKKRAAITAARERAAAAAQQPKRRRRRADDDVIAAAGVGFNRTRSGREH